MFTSLSEIDENRKQELVASLAALLCKPAEESDGVTGEQLEAVAKASGNSLSGAYASLWASVVNAGKGTDKFTMGPGGGGGGGGGSGGGGGGGEAAKEEEPEEEEEADMGGGMDMFGGGDGDGGDY
mmetsp:Transcript_31444/g.46376  ORF Transcript_31444/g.46376 Transcript_31444/m.46376 type:complete len:126 (-) Transcript_31444:372-749(-)